MAAQPRLKFAAITPEACLNAERTAEFKSEYYQGRVYAMAGASDAHNLVNLNAGTALNNALAERDCTVRVNDMRLQVRENGLYTYPDLSVVCGPPKFAPDKFLDTLLNPIVLGEVSSRNTGGLRPGRQFHAVRGHPDPAPLPAAGKQPAACAPGHLA